ncbi:eukaryotic translation initiation factor 2A [Cavenderia fasciculata]|uniref:Eukaryotic translation initiation factor 2A n=1 Tax=Cavenderia fasciculata TaxID=261658 RepID=F4PT50_CACFS|nr:eukaryotic translation initiation factor 2A [Cavenderia fasciculata]EGG21626.1 eukaryotic translation initiation factor 2A [Cavenderia fasciculata]|eukprot:XP_004359476.1 eukaryotic translation initiation factor 2A [Cavenderia fasciculata]
MSTSTTSTASTAPTTANVAADTSSSSSSSPSLQFTLRSKTVVQSQTSPAYGKNDKLYHSDQAQECKHIEYSSDGALIAYVHTTHIEVRRSESCEVYARIERPNVSFVSFSPMNSFLLTWERCSPELNNNDSNLVVWDLVTCKVLHQTGQRYCNQDQWPLVRWTDDEMLAGRLVQNEIHFYNGRNIGLAAKKLRLPDLASFEFAPGEQRGGYRFSVFVPERKGAIPGMCRIYTYPNTNEHNSHISFFKANEAKMFWNCSGDALLIHTATDTDKTGKSYYGETGLWYLSLDGTSFSLGIKGPIHDVKWAPHCNNFVVCYGNPFQSTMFNAKGAPIIDFGSLPRNTVRFSPNGKLLMLGGFGNLQGDMDFWDLTKFKRVASTTAHCAVYTEWAADSVHLLTAVLSPRIRVDNGVKLFRYDGSIVFKQDIPELYQVLWRPQSAHAFADLPIVYPSATQLQQTSSPPPQKYTPPSLRALQAAAPAKPVQSPSEINPPGFKIHIPLTGASSTSPTNTSPVPTGGRRRGAGIDTSTSAPKPAAQPQKSPAEEQRDKRIAVLEKKLKDIADLKTRRDNGDPLPPKQLGIIETEKKLQDELDTLKKQ